MKSESEEEAITQPMLSNEIIDYDEALARIGFGPGQIIVLLITSLCWLGMGIFLNVVGLLPDELMCERSLLPVELSLVPLAGRIGTIIGNFTFGFVYDKYSKIHSITASSIILFIGFIVLRFSDNLYILSLSFFICGLGAGGINITDGYLLDFIAPSNSKYTVVILIGHLSYTLGNVFTTVLAYFSITTLGWRSWILIILVPIAVLILMTLIAPESPLTNFRQKNDKQANKTLKKIAILNKIDMDAHIQNDAMGDSTESEDADSKSVISCWKTTLVLLTVFINGFMAFSFFLELNKVQHGCTSNDYESVRKVNSSASEFKCITLTRDDFMFHIVSTSMEVISIIASMIMLKFLKTKYVLMLSFVLFAVLNSIFILCLNHMLNMIIIVVTKITFYINTSVIFIYLAEYFPKEVRARYFAAANIMFTLGLIAAPFSVQYLFFISRTYMILSTSLSGILGGFLCLFLIKM